MTTTRGGNSINGAGLQSIPAASRKMIQSLKEIVNCPEAEIYSVLKECNMDPNETVNRLLSQDPFHEVKSKREKKKETKDPTEPKPRGGRGSKVGSDHYFGQSGGSTQFCSYEHKKENGVNPYIGAASGITNNTSRLPPYASNPITTENKLMPAVTIDSDLVSPQLHGYQPAWSGTPGHVSMADIVKMGRPHGKVMNTVNSSQHVNHHHVQAPKSKLSHYDVHLSEYPVTKVSELDHETRVDTEQQSAPDDNWPIDDHIHVDKCPLVKEQTNASGLNADISIISINRNSLLPQSQADEVRLGDASIENISSTRIGSVCTSPRRIDEANVCNKSHFNNELCSDTGSYQPHMHNFENQEDVEADVHVSSMTTNMQHLSVEEDQELQLEVENSTVIIPDHLQAQAAECLHLSFGTFGSGISAAFSGPCTSREKHSLEGASVDVASVSSAGQSETRNLEYYENEPIRTTVGENLGHINCANAESYEPPSASEPTDAEPSTSSYDFGNHLNAAFAQNQSLSHMQNLNQFSSAMQPTYSNSQTNSLLASNARATRESDLSYSPFPMTRSMATKYGNASSSIGGATISIPDAGLPGNNLGTGPTLPQQHLSVHPYSQPTHPLGPFSNMVSYPFLAPQSYTYMPSAFQQQALASNGPYHQSLAAAAALLPQYKNNVSSVSSLPQSSVYGGFGNSTNQLSNFPMNPPPTAPGYDDIGGSYQYNDINHLISLQQNENSPLWLHRPGTRTMSAVPSNTYYSSTRQNQQAAGFRQTQQPSQDYRYQNHYHSQAAMAMERQHQHQNQNPRDSLVGSQGQSSRQSQQLWQNS
ncbi:uncharacterized protein LOC124913938 isoform X2 [Impatiens glandulifera]|uniref:uncharacterized protein LOC124913938 isoform X2 n=1 Tax=Impatiens glandulifera TaxID=253017 RepID=UPI001FB1055D|nr:uncharacterized protein LOC124913938 isoform X2 [Impatiens glandulifera]